METKSCEEKIKQQRNIIRRLRKEKQKLEKEIERLNQDLYSKNNTRPNNHKTMLRVKDIIDMYPVGKSTVWLYAKKDITPIKISSRVTVFEAQEVKEFFKSINKQARDITPNLDAKVAKERKIKKDTAPKLPSKMKLAKYKNR